jgi:hypothetical protein
MMDEENNDRCELVEPFDITEGSLRDMTPGYVFALGVGWQLFRQRLESGTPFPRRRLDFDSTSNHSKQLV